MLYQLKLNRLISREKFPLRGWEYASCKSLRKSKTLQLSQKMGRWDETAS